MLNDHLCFYVFMFLCFLTQDATMSRIMNGLYEYLKKDIMTYDFEFE